MNIINRIIKQFSHTEPTISVVENVTIKKVNYDIKNDLVNKLTVIKNSIDDVVKSFEGSVPNIASDMELMVEVQNYTCYAVKGSTHTLVECINCDDILKSLIKSICNENYRKRICNENYRSTLRISCTYKNYNVYTTIIEARTNYSNNKCELYTSNELPQSVKLIRLIEKILKWINITNSTNYLYNINYAFKQYSCSDDVFIAGDTLRLTFATNMFLNFNYAIQHNEKLKTLQYNSDTISFNISVDDSIENIRNSIIETQKHIDDLFEYEKKFLKEHLQSIIAVYYKNNINSTIIHTSNSAPGVINDTKIEYTDLFTGLRNTLIIDDIIARFSIDDLTQKHTTLLPKSHMNLFNQNSLELL